MATASTFSFKPTIRHLSLSVSPITALAVCDDATKLIAGVNPRNIAILKFDSSERSYAHLNAHTDIVTAVCFNNTGDIYGACSLDGTVRVYNPIFNSRLKSTKFGSFRALQFNSDSFKLVAACDNCVNIHPTERLSQPQILRGHKNLVRCVRLSSDSQLVLSGSDDTRMKLWDVRMKTLVRSFPVDEKITTVAMRPSSPILIAGTIRNYFAVYDMRNEDLLKMLLGPDLETPINASTFTSCGRFLLSSTKDAKLRVFDMVEKRNFPILDTLYTPINASNFSTCGNYFVTSGVNNVIQTWNLGLTFGSSNETESQNFEPNVSDQQI